MAEEKTHAPTPRKITKARKEGNVAKSTDVVAIFSLAAGALALALLALWWGAELSRLYEKCVAQIADPEFSRADVINLFGGVVFSISKMLLAMFLALVVAGVAGNVAQFGLLFAPNAISPKFSKINPIKGLKNVFSLKKMLDGALISTKVLLALCIGGVAVFFALKGVGRVILGDVKTQISWLANSAAWVLMAVFLVFLVAGIADFFIKRAQYTKSLKMSQKELKDELRQAEGSPEIRAKIRQMMQKAAMRKMISEIPKADVIITNPTHYAIALRFTDDDIAPVVIAKGVDFLAQRIKKIGTENLIPIVENPPLARALYAQIDVGAVISRDMFAAVAEIFATIRAGL